MEKLVKYAAIAFSSLLFANASHATSKDWEISVKGHYSEVQISDNLFNMSCADKPETCGIAQSIDGRVFFISTNRTLYLGNYSGIALPNPDADNFEEQVQSFFSHGEVQGEDVTTP